MVNLALAVPWRGLTASTGIVLDFCTDERSCRERLEELAFEQSGA